MKKQFIIASVMLSLMSTTAWAKTVADVDVPESITVNEQVMQLNGAGVRSKFFMDLYVGSLFTQSQVNEAPPVVEGSMASAIRLNITSGMINSEKLTNALNDGFDLATGGDPSAIAPSIENFVKFTFAEEIKEGDQFTLVSIPQEGVYSYKNGQQLSFTQDEAFRKALMLIWLGKKPTDKQLKKDMLKG
ncbi:chalcone isomerase family protein [Shewanella youngdeokensis]|uniref:Chalcone isomerase family protein n=1 Tax=Shewanella youngdeokensis TaxID=2999068 RepID=A0ABZ0JUL7_9GAMM|nr:chalcone isomerase family protein [Shewanella sp. DAU334]